MTPELERFIDLVVRPLGQRDAAREEARAELMGRLSHQGVPVDMIDVSEPTARLESAPQRKAWPRRVALTLGLLLLTVIGLTGAARDFLAGLRMGLASDLSWQSYYGGYDDRDEFWPQFLFRWLEREAPDLLLTGRPGQEETALLRERFPEDLAVLQEHLTRVPGDAPGFMTKEERELIARLDPDNALWPLLEMKWEFVKASGGDPWSTHRGRVRDPKAYRRGLERFREAAALPQMNHYGQALARRQVEAFQPESTVFGGMLRERFVQLVRSNSGRNRYYYSSSRAQSLSQALNELNEEELAPFFEDWQKLALLRLQSMDSAAWQFDSFDEQLQEEARSFQYHFSQAGVAEQRDRADRILTALASGHSSRRLPGGLGGAAGVRVQESGPLPPDLTVEELKPSREADMAMFHRFALWPAAAIAILFCLLCAFEAGRRHVVVQGMARGLMPLLTWRDHAWIGGIGIALPWAYWWCVSRLTPVGFDGFNIDGPNDELEALGWILQLILGLILGIVLMVQAVQWRWAKVGEFLGLKRSASWLGWIAAGFVALALPMVGLLKFLTLPDEEDQLLFIGGCAGAGAVGLLWLLWVGGMNLFTPRHSALQANLVARTLRPWAIAGLASILLAAGVLRFMESWWYQRDTLLPTWTSQTYTNALEERWIAHRYEELKAAFEAE
ncbi:hypothetical protein HAHE_21390 [Haloferula helveola]|uniref:DUF4129 domain-containing protein n=1 Tax=Haloferula helveola TaxID=490095 RepID=A0ABM7REW2_9BACT|nr:hypothetical protein HAHE_21390 [Haloferula helveola]